MSDSLNRSQLRIPLLDVSCLPPDFDNREKLLDEYRTSGIPPFIVTSGDYNLFVAGVFEERFGEFDLNSPFSARLHRAIKAAALCFTCEIDGTATDCVVLPASHAKALYGSYDVCESVDSPICLICRSTVPSAWLKEPTQEAGCNPNQLTGGNQLASLDDEADRYEALEITINLYRENNPPEGDVSEIVGDAILQLWSLGLETGKASARFWLQRACDFDWSGKRRAQALLAQDLSYDESPDINKMLELCSQIIEEEGEDSFWPARALALKIASLFHPDSGERKQYRIRLSQILDEQYAASEKEPSEFFYDAWGPYAIPREAASKNMMTRLADKLRRPTAKKVTWIGDDLSVYEAALRGDEAGELLGYPIIQCSAGLFSKHPRDTYLVALNLVPGTARGIDLDYCRCRDSGELIWDLSQEEIRMLVEVTESEKFKRRIGEIAKLVKSTCKKSLEAMGEAEDGSQMLGGAAAKT